MQRYGHDHSSRYDHHACDHAHPNDPRLYAFFCRRLFFFGIEQQIVPCFVDLFYVTLRHTADRVRVRRCRLDIIRAVFIEFRQNFVIEIFALGAICVVVRFVELLDIFRFRFFRHIQFATEEVFDELCHVAVRVVAALVFREIFGVRFVIFLRLQQLLRRADLRCIHVAKVRRVRCVVLRVCVQQRVADKFGLIPAVIIFYERYARRLVLVHAFERVVCVLVTRVVDTGKILAFRTAGVIVQVIAVRLPKGCARRVEGHRDRRRRQFTVRRALFYDRFLNHRVRYRTSRFRRYVHIRIYALTVFRTDFYHRSIGNVRRHVRHDVHRVVRVDRVPAVSQALAIVHVIQLRLFRTHIRRAREIDPCVVAVRFITLDRVVIALRFFCRHVRNVFRRFFVVMRMHRRRKTHTVQNELTKVYIRVRSVITKIITARACVLVHRLFVEIVRSAVRAAVIRNGVACFASIDSRHLRRSVYAIDLIVAGRGRIVFFHIVLDVHRVVHVGVRRIRFVVEKARFRVLNQDRAIARRRVVRFQRFVFFVQTEYVFFAVVVSIYTVHLHKTVGRRRGQTEIMSAHRRFRAVQLCTLEVDIAITCLTGHVLVRRRRCIIHVVAENIQTCVEILRREQRRNYDFRLIVVAFRQVRFLDRHQRAFYGRAVAVVRRRRFYAVDEIDVAAFFHRKAAVGCNVRAACHRRLIIRELFFALVRGVFAATRQRKGRYAQHQRRRERENFCSFLHMDKDSLLIK